MTPQGMNEHLDAVIEAAVDRFVAQSARLNDSPPLGSLVRVAGRGHVIYGIVTGITTGSIEPGRRPVVPGGVTGDAADYLERSPHLALLLRTTYEALAVGQGQGEGVRHYLPPAPPDLYAGVALCTPGEALAFLQPGFDFLSLVVGQPQADDALAAFLRQAAALQTDAHGFLLAAGKALADRLAADPVRLTDLLRRIRP